MIKCPKKTRGMVITVMNNKGKILLSLIVGISIFLTSAGITFVNALEIQEINKEWQHRMENTYYMEYDQDYKGVEVYSLRLYPNMIEVGQSTKLIVTIENNENHENSGYVKIYAQNDLEERYFTFYPKEWNYTLEKYNGYPMDFSIFSEESAGSWLTEIIEIEVYSKNNTLLDHKSIPIKSTANLDWID